jgi:hypothetical protein
MTQSLDAQARFASYMATLGAAPGQSHAEGNSDREWIATVADRHARSSLPEPRSTA